MRKTQAKRQRIPRRGPGVAELEKILKEQEGGAATQHISPHTNSTTSTATTHPLSLNPPRPPPPPPPPPLVPIMTPPPPRDYASWSNNLPLFPTLEFIPPPDLPTVVAAEKPLFPTTRISESQLNLAPHFLPSFQYSASSFNLDQYYNSMVNVNQGSGSSCPSATSSSAGRYFREIEHPSSQISTDFNNIWTSPEEQEKMVNAKRVRPFLEESYREEANNNNNNNNIEKMRVENNIMGIKDSSSSSSSSMEINCSPFHFHSNFRGTKRGFGGQLMMSNTKRSGRYQLGDQESNLMALGSSSSSAPNEIPTFNIFHLPQETMEVPQHRDEGGCPSDYYKVNFNFSLYESNSNTKGNREIAISSGAGAGAEAEAEGIDLNLKL